MSNKLVSEGLITSDDLSRIYTALEMLIPEMEKVKVSLTFESIELGEGMITITDENGHEWEYDEGEEITIPPNAYAGSSDD